MAKQIEVIKVFNAPLSMVWQVWVEPELIKRWWGLKDFVSPLAVMDFREGGKSLVSMKAPKEMGNQEWFSIWEYIKIDPLSRIEFIQSLSDRDGNKTHPTKVGMPPDFPLEIKTVVTFRSLAENRTEMTVVEYADFASISNFAQIGLEQSLFKMEAIFQK